VNANGLPAPSPARPADRGTLVDVLDRILDKGVVIAGDVSISLLDIELLTIRIRLLIASADKARELGIDWWQHDSHFSSGARPEQPTKALEQENQSLRRRIERLEGQLEVLRQTVPARRGGKGAEA